MDLTCRHCKFVGKNKTYLALHSKNHIKRGDIIVHHSPEWLSQFNKIVKQNQNLEKWLPKFGKLLKQYENSPEWLTQFNELIEQNQKTTSIAQPESSECLL